MRRGDAIGTRHSGLTVGNAADRDDGSQSWHGPTASPPPGSPTGLPPRSSSCSPPCAHEQQLPRWRGGQRAERGGLFGKTTIRTEASSCADAAGPHLLSAWCSRQRTRARRPRLLPALCSAPYRIPGEGRLAHAPLCRNTRRLPPSSQERPVSGTPASAPHSPHPLFSWTPQAGSPLRCLRILPGAPCSLGVTSSAPKIQPHPDSRAPVNVAVFGKKGFCRCD